MRVDSVHREKGMDRHDESSVFVSDVYHDESRLSPSRERHDRHDESSTQSIL